MRRMLVMTMLILGCIVEDDPPPETECTVVWPDCEDIGNACVDGVCVSISLECDVDDDCQEGYECASTRACSLPCDSRAGCQGGLVCPEEIGHCSDPCDSDDDCNLVPGAVCNLGNGICWYAVEGDP